MSNHPNYKTVENAALASPDGREVLGALTKSSGWNLIASNAGGCANLHMNIYQSRQDAITMEYFCIGGDGKKGPMKAVQMVIPDPNVLSKMEVIINRSTRSKWWIYDIKGDYLIVGNPDTRKIWIYSSEEDMTFCMYKSLVRDMEKFGYDTVGLAPHLATLSACSASEMSSSATTVAAAPKAAVPAVPAAGLGNAPF